MALANRITIPGTELVSSAIRCSLVAATLLFFVGLVDDFANLRARTKLAFQIIAATYAYYCGVTAFDCTVILFGHNVGPLISYSATVLWILGISNAINIIDGIDGLAAGSAFFSATTILVMALLGKNLLLAAYCVIICGSLLGFLRFNFNPATVFLGDCGSLFVGFMLAVLSLLGKHTSAPTLVVSAAPIIALGLPITETLVSITRRLMRGVGIFVPDREHIHHRLLDMGLSQRQAVALLYGFSALCALASILVLYPDPLTTAFIMFLMIGLVGLGIQKLGYAEFEEFGRIVHRTLEQKYVIPNSVQFRCAAKELERASTFDQVYVILKRSVEHANLSGFHLLITAVDKPSNAVVGIPRSLKWEKSGQSTEQPKWKLTLQLQTKEQDELGQLIIEGLVGERQILFDPNVLLLDLQPALCAAIEKLLATSQFKVKGNRNRKMVMRLVEDSDLVGSRPN